MSRPVKIREPSEHVTTLSRMVQQVQADERLSSRRKRRIVEPLQLAMAELQKEVLAVAPPEGG